MRTLHAILDIIWVSVCIVFMFYITNNSSIFRPKVFATHEWQIEKRQHPILYSLSGHNYLVLRDDEGNIVSELHGLPTDPNTLEFRDEASKRGDLLLQVHEYKTSKYINNTIPSIGEVIFTGNKQDANELWENALMCKDYINNLNIPYPRYGFRFTKETTNSNSVAHTLINCMGLTDNNIGLITPGEAVDLLDNK